MPKIALRTGGKVGASIFILPFSHYTFFNQLAITSFICISLTVYKPELFDKCICPVLDWPKTSFFHNWKPEHTFLENPVVTNMIKILSISFSQKCPCSSPITLHHLSSSLWPVSVTQSRFAFSKSFRWSEYAECILWGLASFSQHSILEIHPHILAVACTIQATLWNLW